MKKGDRQSVYDDMSAQYDLYLQQHRANVHKGFQWIQENLPELLADGVAWQTEFSHDASKNEPDEYEAYDRYFYGNNKSYQVVQDYRRAWLFHLHRNPHHWQHWILINDDPKEGEIALDMPYNYILEMICDWWAFSWQKGNLYEMFNWYDDHEAYIKMSQKTRKTVDDILGKIKSKLDENSELRHHGVKGQKWGVKNGPPYPVDRSSQGDTIVKDAIESGQVSKTINREKQMRHTKDGHPPGRSYIDGDLEYAQELVDELSGTGIPVRDKNGNWTHQERVVNSHILGTHVERESGTETKTNKAVITYSKTGTHIYPAKKGE